MSLGMELGLGPGDFVLDDAKRRYINTLPFLSFDRSIDPNVSVSSTSFTLNEAATSFHTSSAVLKVDVQSLAST